MPATTNRRLAKELPPRDGGPHGTNLHVVYLCASLSDRPFHESGGV